MTEPSEMIERGAEAMWRAESIRATGKDRNVPWAEAGDETRDRFRWLMKVAIEALRDPTEAMVIAGCRHENIWDMEGRWQAMIDEALR